MYVHETDEPPSLFYQLFVVSVFFTVYKQTGLRGPSGWSGGSKQTVFVKQTEFNTISVCLCVCVCVGVCL